MKEIEYLIPPEEEINEDLLTLEACEKKFRKSSQDLESMFYAFENTSELNHNVKKGIEILLNEQESINSELENIIEALRIKLEKNRRNY